MTKIRNMLLAAALMVAAPLVASATPTQVMPTNAKVGFMQGKYQVMASACTGAGAPSPCCTGAGAGSTCPTYKMALITNTSTAGASTTTWSGISANEVGASGTYATGGATLAGMAVSGTCTTFTSPVSFTSATITARAAVIYCSANCPTLDVIGIYCLDGGSCAADTVSTGGTFSITLPAGGPYCIN